MTFPEPHAKEVDPPVITPKRNIVKKHDKYQETKILNFFEEFEQYLMFLSLVSGAPNLCGHFNFKVNDTADKFAKQLISLVSGYQQRIPATCNSSYPHWWKHVRSRFNYL